MMETETVELKTSLAELKQGLVSLTAMLNKHGQAELWFGVAPDGRVQGLTLNDKTLRDVAQAIAAMARAMVAIGKSSTTPTNLHETCVPL